MKTKIDTKELVNGVKEAFSAVKNPKRRGRPVKKTISEIIKEKASAHVKHVKKLNSKLKSHLTSAGSKVKSMIKNPEEKDLWAVTTNIGHSGGDKVISTHRTKESADKKCTRREFQFCDVRKVSGKHSRYEIDGNYVKLRNPSAPVKNPKLDLNKPVQQTLAKAIYDGIKLGLTVDQSVIAFQEKYGFKCGKSLVDLACRISIEMIAADKSVLHNPKTTQKTTPKTMQKRGGTFSELTKKR